MKQEISEKEALLRLAALCAQGEHCQWEMTEKLRKWEIGEEAQARIMQKLVSGGYVDDERFARAFAMDKVRYNKWGRRKVEQALWQKHISEDIRQRVLDEVDADDYARVLRPLLQQKRRTTKAQSDYELQQKLVRFALSRGYTMDVIRQCMEVDDAIEAEDEL